MQPEKVKKEENIIQEFYDDSTKKHKKKSKQEGEYTVGRGIQPGKLIRNKR